jgi:2-methylcitrate dehydratase PrpD
VAIRGTKSDSSKPLYRFLSGRQDQIKGVPVIATQLKLDAPYAALALGTAAHSLELDDVVNAASLHPAVSVISAALAAGYMAQCTGPELIEGIVNGYEVMVKLGIALDPTAHYARGFHPTGTCGTLGAAVATAKILKLDANKTAHALGIAGSQAAGSLEFLSDGAFTKRFHAGWSAHSGLVAAMLAAEGFTGPHTIIEGKFGFLHAYSIDSDHKKVLAHWGDPFEVMHTSIKPHACCRYKQGPIDCILQIVEQNNLTPEDIDHVQVSILKAGFALVADPPDLKSNPASVVDAQFSMPFGAALAILKKSASLDQYCMENILSEDIRQMMKRVSCVEDAEIETEFPRKWPARVKITSRDGQVFQAGLQYPKGDPENPLSWDEIILKFNNLAAKVLDDNDCSQLISSVRNLENITDVRNLIDGLIN